MGYWPLRYWPDDLTPAWYTAPDNAGVAAIKAKTDTINWGDVTSLLTDSLAMSKWKNNKLVKTVSGTVETWKLYDNDNTTVLLTWTWDTSTLTRTKAI